MSNESWCVLHHPHDGDCQDMADIWFHNDGKHHCEEESK